MGAKYNITLPGRKTLQVFGPPRLVRRVQKWADAIAAAKEAKHPGYTHDVMTECVVDAKGNPETILRFLAARFAHLDPLRERTANPEARQRIPDEILDWLNAPSPPTLAEQEAARAAESARRHAEILDTIEMFQRDPKFRAEVLRIARERGQLQ